MKKKIETNFDETNNITENNDEITMPVKKPATKKKTKTVKKKTDAVDSTETVETPAVEITSNTDEETLTEFEQVQEEIVKEQTKLKKIKKDKAETTAPATKVCKNCGKEKPVREFNYWNKEKQSYMDICKECEKEKNKEKHEKKREIINNLKKSGCVCCGERELCCLDFHHIDQEHKEFNMGSALNKTDKKIVEEAAKCVVVCSNCHRKIHAGLIDIFDYINPIQYSYLRQLISISQSNVNAQQQSQGYVHPKNED